LAFEKFGQGQRERERERKKEKKEKMDLERLRLERDGEEEVRQLSCVGRYGGGRKIRIKRDRIQ
jgi:hypothetical protein